MKYSKQELKKYFQKVRKGGRGFYVVCPFCKHDEAGIINGKEQVFNCFRKKHCGESGEIGYILRRLGFKTQEKSSFSETIEGLQDEVKQQIKIPEIKLPVGCKRIYDNPYLKSRGFTDNDFYKYEITKTDLDIKYRDYIIISVFQQGKRVAYIARYTGEEDKPKYLNSKVDFEYILGGYDEITENTKTVILTEGLFDKISIDNKLELDEEIRCLTTFGAKLSEHQIEMLLGVENIILFFDNDVATTNKSVGNLLYLRFNSVRIVDYEGEDDPNSMDCGKLIDVLENRTRNVFEYNKLYGI